MELITFDLDETLVHAKKCHWRAFNEAFKKYNLPCVRYNKILPLLNGRHAHQVAKELCPRLSEEKIDKIVKEHHRLIAGKYGKCARRIKGVIPALKKIKKRFKIGIISNCSHKEIDGLLKGAKLSKRLFDIIVGKDDVKKSKPYPNELFKAEKIMHEKIKYHVGDSPYDIIAARKAGIKAIGVLTGVNSRKTLEKEKPYKIVKSIINIEKILFKKENLVKEKRKK